MGRGGGGRVSWNNYEGDFSRQLGDKGERMGPKGLEIRAENLDFFLKEVHASEALFREDNPLRDVEETCPNLVSLSLSLWFLFRFMRSCQWKCKHERKGTRGRGTTHVSSLTRFHVLCGRGQCFRSNSYATIL